MKVQFYIIDTFDKNLISRFVCQLTEKIFKKKHYIQIQLVSNEQLIFYDDELWDFHPDSFIPHLTDADATDKNIDIPIILTYDVKYQNKKHDILLSLNSSYSVNSEKYNQLLYIIDSTENSLINARKLFKMYKEKKYQINTHKIKLTESLI